MNQIRPDRTPKFDSIVENLEKHGYRFTHDEVSWEDPCLPIDVEWNYKDMTHVEFVHSGQWLKLWREFVYIGENTYTTLDLRNVFGLSVPQSTTFYSTKDNRLIAHTSLFFFVILVEVKFEATGDFGTKTTTRHAIGAKNPIARLFIPLINYATRKNWRQFTEDDLPLRRRRGELRKKGYSFLDQSPVDLRETLQVGGMGVFPSDKAPDVSRFDVEVAKNMGETVKVGNDDHFGLQIGISDNEIKIFPRLCPHRGASLDYDYSLGRPPSNCHDSTITCAWHGRKFTPLCTIDNNSQPQIFDGPYHQCRYDGETLAITVKQPPYEAGEHPAPDWSQRWQAREG